VWRYKKEEDDIPVYVYVRPKNAECIIGRFKKYTGSRMNTFLIGCMASVVSMSST
jgi:hypothetical protein